MALLYHFWQYRAYFSVRYCLKKTVQKYDGVYSLRLAQPGRFVVDLLLPIDAAAPVEQVFVWESAKEALV